MRAFVASSCIAAPIRAWLPTARALLLVTVAMPAAACLVSLAGCAAQERLAARSELNAANAACDAQWPKVVGNFVPRAECLNRAFTLAAPRLGLHGDLVELFNAARSSLAVKADRGEITPEDMNLRLAELKTQLASEQQRRTAEQAAVSAQRAAAFGAILSGIGAMRRAYQPIPLPTIQPNPMVNCMSMPLGGGMMSTICH